MLGDTSFVGLAPTEDPTVWSLPVTQDVCGGRGQLFGGCGYGAAIEILEHLTGRPAAWATGQFVSAARPPETIRLEAGVRATGRSFTQAEVVCSVDERPFLTVLAALGSRPLDVEVPAVRPTPVTGPADSTPHAFDPGESRFITRLDCRVATPTGADDRPPATNWYWVRTRGIPAGSTIALAVVADLVPLALTDTVGRPLFGSSLDNTMRFTARSTDDWVLAEMHVESIAGAVAHVRNHIWTGSGTLLAIGSQTCAVSER